MGYLGFPPFALEAFAMYHRVQPSRALGPPAADRATKKLPLTSEGGDATVTKKRGKTAKQGSVKKAAAGGQKKTMGKSVKAAPAKPAARPAAVATKAKAPVRPAAPARAAAPRAAAAAMPSAVIRAERLREDIQRSKMTHPDPWGYTAKARGWSDRAERLVADAQTGRDVRSALDALTTELDADRDFREARRLF